MTDYQIPNVRIHEGSGVEDDEVQRDRDDERRMAAALAGQISDRQGRNADRYRGVIERRVASCVSVAGCTLAALKTQDPEQYRRFLRGCSRAIRREAAMADGTLSLGDVAELRRRFTKQREIDQYAAEFPDFEDPGERYP